MASLPLWFALNLLSLASLVVFSCSDPISGLDWLLTYQFLLPIIFFAWYAFSVPCVVHFQLLSWFSLSLSLSLSLFVFFAENVSEALSLLC